MVVIDSIIAGGVAGIVGGMLIGTGQAITEYWIKPHLKRLKKHQDKHMKRFRKKMQNRKA